MDTFAKAFLQELDGKTPPGKVGGELPVQFNPTSLRIQFTNNNEGTEARARQTQQHLGTSSATLSLDLVFDTADEGTSEVPRNVREKTQHVRKFLLPAKGSKKPPPKVRFQWGTFAFDGVMTGCTEEIDLFSATGVPLRAKCSISMKEQKPEFAALKSGAGVAQGENKKKPGESGAGPGTGGGGPTDASAPALAGESAADFAARMGLDPAAWRGLAAGLDATLSLEAGLEIDFDASLSLSAGIGLSAGIEAGVSASLEASFGLEAGLDVSVSGSAGADLAAGFALSAAGGVTAAVESVQIAKSAAAAASARGAFGAAAPTPAAPGAPAAPQSPVGATAAAGASPRPARTPQPRPALAAAGLPGAGAQAAAAAAPAPPRADPRTASFGFGVPLRPRAAGATEARQGTLHGGGVVGPRYAAGAPTTSAPGVAPWHALPHAYAPRAAADRRQALLRPSAACRCGGRGRHGGCGCGGRR